MAKIGQGSPVANCWRAKACNGAAGWVVPVVATDDEVLDDVVAGSDVDDVVGWVVAAASLVAVVGASVVVVGPDDDDVVVVSVVADDVAVAAPTAASSPFSAKKAPRAASPMMIASVNGRFGPLKKKPMIPPRGADPDALAGVSPVVMWGDDGRTGVSGGT